MLFLECAFCKDGVTVFLELLKDTMGRSIMMHDNQELYARELAEAHALLQEVYRVVSTNGILIGLREVDGPITYTEMATATGLISVIGDAVILTEKGERAAEEVATR